MKDEIKEILDKLKKLCYDDYCLEFSVDYIERKEEKLLLDYITNLQEEKNMFKNSFETMSKNYFEEKSRNEKAIEKLKTLIPICIMPNNTLIHGTEKAKTIEEALNILQGEDK